MFIFSYFRKAYGGLHRSIYILFLSTVINRMGGFVHAFLAMLLSTRLGYTPAKIADFILLTGVISMLAPFIGAHLADRYQRKLTYVVSSMIAGLFYLTAGLLSYDQLELIPYLLMAAAFFFAVGEPVRSAMVADICEDEESRRRSYSLIYLGINIGVAIGPLIGGRLLAHHLDVFFYAGTISTLLSLSLVLLFVKETLPGADTVKNKTGREQAASGTTFKLLWERKLLLSFILVSLLGNLIYAQYGFGLQLKLTESFGNAQAPILFGNLTAFNAVIVVGLTVFLTRLTQGLGITTNLTIAAFLNAVGFGMYALFERSIALYYFSVLIWTLGEILNVTNMNVFIMKHTPINYRARFGAVSQLMGGVAFMLSPKIMQWLMQYYNMNTGWLIYGSLGLAGTLGMFLIGRAEVVSENRVA